MALLRKANFKNLKATWPDLAVVLGGLVEGSIPATAFSSARGCGSRQEIDRVIAALDECLETYGDESIEGDYNNSYYGNIQFIYLNAGDSYAETLIYDCVRQTWHIGCAGDLCESSPRSEYGKRLLLGQGMERRF